MFSADSGATVMRVSEPPERLVKSVERVREIGEVLTPEKTVNDMLDTLPPAIWDVHPAPTFFEPGCGNGNFLVALFERKLDRVRKAYEVGDLPAGDDLEALEIHALEGLASIYGVDICAVNVIGRSKSDEIGARERLVSVLTDWYGRVTGDSLDESDPLLTSAEWIANRNIVVADMLRLGTGSASTRVESPLVEYEWDPDAPSVTVRRTSLNETMENALEEQADMKVLHVAANEESWTVHPLKLSDVPIEAPRLPRRRARNGSGWRSR